MANADSGIPVPQRMSGRHRHRTGTPAARAPEAAMHAEAASRKPDLAEGPDAVDDAVAAESKPRIDRGNPCGTPCWSRCKAPCGALETGLERKAWPDTATKRRLPPGCRWPGMAAGNGEAPTGKPPQSRRKPDRAGRMAAVASRETAPEFRLACPEASGVSRTVETAKGQFGPECLDRGSPAPESPDLVRRSRRARGWNRRCETPERTKSAELPHSGETPEAGKSAGGGKARFCAVCRIGAWVENIGSEPPLVAVSAKIDQSSPSVNRNFRRTVLGPWRDHAWQNRAMPTH